MGFSCGIYWAPKINEDITLHEIDSVQIYYDYFHNEWAQKNYSTAEKYLESRGYYVSFYNEEPEKTNYLILKNLEKLSETFKSSIMSSKCGSLPP